MHSLLLGASGRTAAPDAAPALPATLLATERMLTMPPPKYTAATEAAGPPPRDAILTGEIIRKAEELLVRCYVAETCVLDLGSAGDAALREEVLWELGRLMLVRDLPCRELRLAGWESPTSVALRSLALSVGPQIQLLDVSRTGTTFDCLTVVTARFHRLTAVDLSFCRQINDSCVAAIVGSAAKSLTALDLSGCSRVTDDALGWVAGTVGPADRVGCKHLLSLRAAQCPTIRDRAMWHLARGVCKRLRFLDLSFSAEITDVGLEGLAEGCPRLQVLDLDGCRHISDEGLRALAHHCRDLRSLTLSKCEWITDRGLWYLGQHCPELQALDIAACFQVTEKGLFFLARGCPFLQQLRCDGDVLISLKGLEHLALGLGKGLVQLATRWLGLEPTAKAPELRLWRQSEIVRHGAAVKIQAFIRRYLANTIVARLRRRDFTKRIAHLVAGVARDKAARAYLSAAERAERERRAAFCIQRRVRRWQARVQRRRWLQRQALEREAARVLDRLKAKLRSLRARREHPDVHDVILLQRAARRGEVEGIACLPVQAVLRGHITRKYLAAAAWERERVRALEERAALRVQTAWRAWVGRQIAHARRTAAIAFSIAVQTLTLTVQRLYRGHRGRARAHWFALVVLPAYRLQRYKAATAFQSAYRGYLARNEAKRREAELRRRTAAAVCIQKLWRGRRIPSWRELAVLLLQERLREGREERREEAEKDRERRLHVNRGRMYHDSASEVDSADDWVPRADGFPGYYSEARNAFTEHVPQWSLERAILGKPVQIYWPIERQWFKGRFTRWVPTRQRFKVVYDDGDKEYLDAHSEHARVMVWWQPRRDMPGVWVMFRNLPHVDWDPNVAILAEATADAEEAALEAEFDADDAVADAVGDGKEGAAEEGKLSADDERPSRAGRRRPKKPTKAELVEAMKRRKALQAKQARTQGSKTAKKRAPLRWTAKGSVDAGAFGGGGGGGGGAVGGGGGWGSGYDPGVYTAAGYDGSASASASAAESGWAWDAATGTWVPSGAAAGTYDASAQGWYDPSGAGSWAAAGAQGYYDGSGTWVATEAGVSGAGTGWWAGYDAWGGATEGASGGGGGGGGGGGMG